MIDSNDTEMSHIGINNFRKNDYSIHLRNVFKAIDSRYVLRNLNITVAKGSIYGLLGPSGCGKTTALNCIMGTTRIDKGEIFVDTQNLSDIGLMPQEVALTSSFNIYETFKFYGKMFGMSNDEIDTKVDELTKLLQLPSTNQRIEHLSGGQQRRVSLAVALLNNPRILLLDEPTVGLDPLLSQRIWNYLLKEANESGKTIIITTHYIEEARQANMIGLMRDGTLLDQGEPRELMEKHNANTLEDVFLTLCRDDGENKEKIMRQPKDGTTTGSTLVRQSPFTKREIFSYKRLRAQIYKNFITLIKEYKLLCFLLLVPVMQSTLRNLTWGQDPKHLPIAVVNQDSDMCINNPMRGCDLRNQSMSCRFLQHLSNTTDFVLQTYGDNIEDNQEEVFKNKIWGLLHFAPNFSASLLDRMLASDFSEITTETLEAGTIQVHLDPSNKIVSDLLKDRLSMEFGNFFTNIFTDCHWPEEVSKPIVKVESPIHGTKHPAFTETQTAPFMFSFFFYMPMMYTAAALMPDKETGATARSYALGMTSNEIAIPVFIVQSVLSVLQISEEFFVEYYLFKNPFVSNFWLPFSLAFLQCFSGTIFGFLINSISQSASFTMVCATAVIFVVTTINGTMWPLEGAHPLVSEVIWWTPLALPSEAFRGITARGWSFFHPKIFTGFLAIIIWTILYLILAIILNHFKK